MKKKLRHYTTPIKVNVIYEMNGRRQGHLLIASKIRKWVSGRGSAIINNGKEIELMVKYPDGMDNSMTCKTISDLKWGFQAFYWEYLKDFETK